MPELTFQSPGVSTTEIDLSGPTAVGPIGVPAGVIGTSNEGPAFVPLTFATYGQYKRTYGDSDGKKFGPIAVSEWTRNAQAVTYVRVLGAGDGKKRSSSTGNVNNAGFVVGSKRVQNDGIVGHNANAVIGGDPGRTYFLGCYMSESAGSTIFSDAGIQKTGPHIKASTRITYDGQPSDGQRITLISSAGTSITYEADSGGAAVGDIISGDKVAFPIGGNPDATYTNLIAAINHDNGHNAGTANSVLEITDGTGGGSATTGTVTITQAGAGTGGNTDVTENMDGCTVAGVDPTTTNKFTGGVDGGHAVPILRGVLLAPSGVMLTLSGAFGSDNAAPSSAVAAKKGAATLKGAATGSVNLAAGGQDFVLFMNGFSGGSGFQPTVITCSFDMTQPNYFANVLNTKAENFESSGHLLYGSHDIYPDMATVTGSGIVNPGREYSSGESQIAFLLTSSIDRIGAGEADPGSGAVPIYESFEDRFSNAKTPFITSQKFGAAPYDLFRLETLSDGSGVTEKFKLSIENISKATSDTDKFGTFDLILRSLGDSDSEKRVLRSFRGLSLDHGSLRFVGRAIGDRKIFYNFDADSDSQKIVVEGSHPVRNKFVRVVLSDALKNKEVPDEALPMGFRGPNHLLTSGSLLQAVHTDAKSLIDSNTLKHVVEPAIPYRLSVTQGSGLSKSVDASLYWGMQTNIKKDPVKPNTDSGFDQSFKTFVKHFPTHRTDTPNFSEGSNAGVADLPGGTVRDSDKFNFNRFSLENIKVRTGSNGKADPDQWISASYVRKGVIAIDAANKTRGLSMEDLSTPSNRKFLKFTVPFQGGFDGVDIFDKDKKNLSNTAAKRELDDEINQGGTSGPTVSAYRKAVDIMASTSDVDIQLLTIPGIRHESVVDYAIDAVEGRFDAMLIADIEERDQFNTVITSSAQSPHVSNTVTAFKNRALDSSFAAVYFPDVTLEDPDTGGLVAVPPSVVTLGAYALNDRIGHPWFAPAGFTRGVLNSVETTNVALNRENLDDLYDADINPLAKYPGRTLSIWGQKTLQAAPSALDRVNVRRLLIDVRRKVRGVANTLLFEPNRTETLERFSSLVNPILQSVQDAQGVDRFKVIIDTTTTTQADVENNTIRGKIFLQPTRSVEFVALDFVVTNAGTTV